MNHKSELSEEEIISQAFHYHAKGDVSQAIKFYKLYIDQGYKNPNVFSNYGVICKNAGRIKEAIDLFQNSIKLFPRSIDAYANLSNIFLELKKLEDAERFARLAIDINPNHANSHNNLGQTLFELGKYEDALSSIKRSISLQSNNVQAHNNLGIILRKLNRLDEAKSSIEVAIKLNPDFYLAYINLGTVLFDQKKFEQAELLFLKALQLDNKCFEAYLNLGELYIFSKKYSHAIQLYHKALDIFPRNDSIKYALLTLYVKTSDWKELALRHDWLKKDPLHFKPMSLMYIEDDPIRELSRAKNYCKTNNLSNCIQLKAIRKKKIRIAYFSNNFCSHSTMILFCRIIELHNKNKFEIFIYDFGHHDFDQYTLRIKEAAFKYQIVKDISDRQLVEVVRADQIDIAVDLMGYTRNNRAKLFSYRVAPIQINYLDYPGTMGNNSIDYIIADKYLIPNEENHFYSEKVIRMTTVLQPTDDTLFKSSRKFTKSDFGLAEDTFVFSCFSKNDKIQISEFEIWMKLLTQINKSVLMLLEPNQIAKDNILKHVSSLGIATSRIIFLKKISLVEHMSRQSCVDIALDTFNFSSGAMTYLCLKSGVPILTLPGKTFSSRLSTSILSALNLYELIASSKDDYEYKAINLYHNPAYLRGIKEKIQESSTSRYFNSSLYCLDLEEKFEEILSNHNYILNDS